MLNFIQKTWNDPSLYGHCLTSLPNKLWSFSTSDNLATYTKPDPGTAERVFYIFEKYIKTNENGITAGTNSLIFSYSELLLRRVVGTFLTVGASLTLAPLGFAIKIIQKGFS
jgi:hypothetical protein